MVLRTKDISRLHIFTSYIPEDCYTDGIGTDIVIFNNDFPLQARIGNTNVVIPAGKFIWPTFAVDEPLAIKDSESIDYSYELRGLKSEHKRFLRKIDLYILFEGHSAIITRGDVHLEKTIKCNDLDSSGTPMNNPPETPMDNPFETPMNNPPETPMDESTRDKLHEEYGTDSGWEIMLARINRDFYKRNCDIASELFHLAVPVYSR